MNERILVIAAHCDDESFGCLGTLLKYKRQKAEFAFMWYTQARDTFGGAGRCRDYFKAETWRFLDYSDQHLDTYPLTELIKPIESMLKKFTPTIVYIPFIADLNRDHRLISEAGMIACRPYKKNSPREVRMYQILGSTELGFREFYDDIQYDIDVEKKEELLRQWYPLEMVNGREDVAKSEHFESWPRM